MDAPRRPGRSQCPGWGILPPFCLRPGRRLAAPHSRRTGAIGSKEQGLSWGRLCSAPTSEIISTGLEEFE